MRSLSHTKLTDDEHDEFESSESAFDLDSENEESLSTLKKEISDLKTQVKYLKRITLLNVFGSKDEIHKFFDDIW